MKVKTLPVVYSYDIGNNRPIFVECRNVSFHAYIICIWVRDHIFFSYMFLVLYIFPYTPLKGKYLKRILCRENCSGIVKIAFRGFQGTHQRTVLGMLSRSCSPGFFVPEKTLNRAPIRGTP